MPPPFMLALGDELQNLGASSSSAARLRLAQDGLGLGSRTASERRAARGSGTVRTGAGRGSRSRAAARRCPGCVAQQATKPIAPTSVPPSHPSHFHHEHEDLHASAPTCRTCAPATGRAGWSRRRSPPGRDAPAQPPDWLPSHATTPTADQEGWRGRSASAPSDHELIIADDRSTLHAVPACACTDHDRRDSARGPETLSGSRQQARASSAGARRARRTRRSHRS